MQLFYSSWADHGGNPPYVGRAHHVGKPATIAKSMRGRSLARRVKEGIIISWAHPRQDGSTAPVMGPGNSDGQLSPTSTRIVHMVARLSLSLCMCVWVGPGCTTTETSKTRWVKFASHPSGRHESKLGNVTGSDSGSRVVQKQEHARPSLVHGVAAYNRNRNKKQDCPWRSAMVRAPSLE